MARIRMAAGLAVLLTGMIGPAIGGVSAAEDAAEPAARQSPWHGPVRLAGPGTLLGVDVAISRHGRELVTWSTERRILASVRIPGHRWGPSVVIGRRGFDVDTAMNLRGDMVVVWRRQLTSTDLILATRRDIHGHWSRPVTLMRGTVAGGTDGPQVAIGPQGRITVGVSIAPEAQVFHPRPTVVSYSGRQWSKPHRLTRQVGAQVDVAAGGDGRTLVAWTSPNAEQPCVATRPAGRRTQWSAAHCLGGKRPRAGTVGAAVDHDGHAYVMTLNAVWSQRPRAPWRHEHIPGGRLNAFDPFSIALDAAGSGRAVAAWSPAVQTGRDTIEADTFAAIRRPDGTWTRPHHLSNTINGPVGITARGTVYLSWPNRNAVRVLRKESGDRWRAATSFIYRREGMGYSGLALAVNFQEQAVLAINSRGFQSAVLRVAWRTPSS